MASTRPQPVSNGMNKKIILASTSPRRKEIFEKLGIPFTVEDSGYEEDLGLKKKPNELARYLALHKAKAVAKRHEDAIVIGADTIVVINGEVVGKARDRQHAMEILKKLSGSSHKVVTGFALINTKDGKVISKAVETKVQFKKLTDKEISDYLLSGEWKGKAGAYDIRGLSSRFVKKVEGDRLNVVGLPLKAFLDELEKIGVRKVIHR